MNSRGQVSPVSLWHGGPSCTSSQDKPAVCARKEETSSVSVRLSRTRAGMQNFCKFSPPLLSYVQWTSGHNCQNGFSASKWNESDLTCLHANRYPAQQHLLSGEGGSQLPLASQLPPAGALPGLGLVQAVLTFHLHRQTVLNISVWTKLLTTNVWFRSIRLNSCVQCSA